MPEHPALWYVLVAFIMSKYGTPADRAKAMQNVKAEVEPLTKRGDLDNGSKMTLLGLSLQQTIGDSVLLAALAHVAGGIQIDPAGEDSPAGEDGEEQTIAKPGLPADAAGTPRMESVANANVTPIRPEIAAEMVLPQTAASSQKEP